jgi:hypothetical protein
VHAQRAVERPDGARCGSEYKFQVKERPGKGPSAGPIYLCVGNDALVELVEATPPERRKDLVRRGRRDAPPRAGEAFMI